MSYQVRVARRALQNTFESNHVRERDEVFCRESHHAAGGHGFSTVEVLRAFCEINSIECYYASEYGEPGYTDSEKGILLSNWNNIPETLSNRLERQGYELEWSDEWYVDGGRTPAKAYRTQPDSTGWESRLLMIDGDYLTPDDGLDEWVEQCKDNPRAALPSWWSEEDINALGWVRTSERFESGFHPGQNDSPKTIAKRLEAADESYVFQVLAKQQFDVHFAVYLNRRAAMFERFSIELKPDDADSGARPGDVSEEIDDLRRVPYIAAQLDALDPELVRAELKEYGYGPEQFTENESESDLSDDEENLNRILWLACGNIRESQS